VTPPPTDRIIERAYFHVGNGGLTLSVIEERSPEDGTASYRFKHEISVFGASSESSFPLGSSDIVSWMNMALQRVSMKVAAAFHERSYQPFDNPPDVTHVNGEEVKKLASLMRIVARYQRQAFEFPTPEALRKYLHDRPHADKSLHWVKEPGDDKEKSEAKPEGKGHEPKHEDEGKDKKEPAAKPKSWKERFQSLSDKAKAFVKNAPGEIKKFLEDEEHRRGVIQKIHHVVEHLPENVAKRVQKAIKHEAEEFKTATEGVKAVLKGEKMSDEQKKAFKEIAFEAALVVATVSITGGLGAGLKGVAFASVEGFSKALAKKVALNSITHGLGRHAKLEEVAHFGHGLSELLERVITAADDEDGDVNTKLLAAYVTKLVNDELKNIDPDMLAKAVEDAAEDKG
jgi:hypothetical protein